MNSSFKSSKSIIALAMLAFLSNTSSFAQAGTQEGREITDNQASGVIEVVETVLGEGSGGGDVASSEKDAKNKESATNKSVAPKKATPARRVVRKKVAPVPAREVIGFELRGNQAFVEATNKRQSEKEALLQAQQISPINMQALMQENTVAAKNYVSEKMTDGFVKFKDTASDNFLNKNEIDTTRSFVVVSWIKSEDIKISVKPLELNSDGNDFSINSQSYLADSGASGSSECSSVAAYVVTKGATKFVYENNEYAKTKSCSKANLVSDSGTLNAEDGYFINVGVLTNEKNQMVNVDVLKDGWSSSIKQEIFNQAALNIFVDKKLSIFINPQIIANKFHYAKVNDISVVNYQKNSPFLFASNMPKDMVYRSFVVLNSDKGFKYYPTTIKIEDLDVEQKLILTH